MESQSQSYYDQNLGHFGSASAQSNQGTTQQPLANQPPTSTFTNVSQGLFGQYRNILANYWQNTIHEIETETHDFKVHHLPLARIKKVMKADDEVKMISAEAPILFAKGCDIFITELTMRAWIHAEENKRRTLQRSDIANAISKSDMFDFLIDIVPREEFVATRTGGSLGPAALGMQNVDHLSQPQSQSQSLTQSQSQIQQNQTRMGAAGGIAGGGGGGGDRYATITSIPPIHTSSSHAIGVGGGGGGGPPSLYLDPITYSFPPLQNTGPFLPDDHDHIHDPSQDPNQHQHQNQIQNQDQVRNHEHENQDHKLIQSGEQDHIRNSALSGPGTPPSIPLHNNGNASSNSNGHGNANGTGNREQLTGQEEESEKSRAHRGSESDAFDDDYHLTTD